MKSFRSSIIVLLIGTGFNYAHAASESDVFSTWEGLEADKCASIWLIKRFISPNAKIRFYPKGDIIDEGIPFDTPDADFRRYHSNSTFETIKQHYQIVDQSVDYIGRIIHDIEINVWEKKLMPETHQVIRELRPTMIEESPIDAVTQCQSYFENFYAKLNHSSMQLR